MPYIKECDREKFDNTFRDLPEISNPGELNYLLTVLCKCYISDNNECYQSFNDALGALEGAKLELYRRQIAPYEDIKVDENGDVEVDG